MARARNKVKMARARNKVKMARARNKANFFAYYEPGGVIRRKSLLLLRPRGSQESKNANANPTECAQPVHPEGLNSHDHPFGGATNKF